MGLAKKISLPPESEHVVFATLEIAISESVAIMQLDEIRSLARIARAIRGEFGAAIRRGIAHGASVLSDLFAHEVIELMRPPGAQEEVELQRDIDEALDEIGP